MKQSTFWEDKVSFAIEIRECMLSLGAEFVVFQFAIQKLKD
jgi:hypothetical protein